MMGALKVPVMVLVLWAATLTGWLRAAPLQNLIVAAVATVVVGEFLTTLAERPFVVKRRLSAPGGWDSVRTSEVPMTFASSFKVSGIEAQ